MAATSATSWRCRLALAAGFVECVLFGGTTAGWSSLVYVLKQEAIFKFLCANATSNGTVSDEASAGDAVVTGSHAANLTWPVGGQCPAEDNMLSLAFTLALVHVGILAIPLGWFFDRFGLRSTRLLGTYVCYIFMRCKNLSLTDRLHISSAPLYRALYLGPKRLTTHCNTILLIS